MLCIIRFRHTLLDIDTDIWGLQSCAMRDASTTVIVIPHAAMRRLVLFYFFMGDMRFLEAALA
jgi:hypothetical protein